MRKEIDFEIVEEQWNRYTLSDGTKIKAKYVLINVIFEGADEAKNPIYFTNSDVILGSYSPEEMVGEPMDEEPSLEKRMDSLIEDPIDFEVKHEDWNEYKFEDGSVFKVKLVLTRVGKTSLFDSKGQPVYLYKTQPLMDISIPKGLREKLKTD